MSNRKELAKLKKRVATKQCTIAVLVAVCIILVLLFIGSMFTIAVMMSDYESLENAYERLQKDKENVIEASTEKDNSIGLLQQIIEEQDQQIQSLSDINKGYVDELNDFYNREELYDKYSYAIINEIGERTELTYAQIKLGEDLMLEKGYDPNLLFGTIMVESGGNPDCVNAYSGATGLGQFMNDTAEYVWCKLMGNDYYYPEIMKDPESNIKMMAYYYDYLYNIKGDTFGVIKSYSGNDTDWGTLQYIQRINNFTGKVGVVIS